MKTDNIKRFNSLSKEIFSLTALSHHNIVKIYDYNFNTRIINPTTIQYEIIIAMELAKETLSKYLKKNPIFNEKQLFKIIITLISALNYAHNKKIVHCDLKPANILVFEDNKAIDFKISDWGSGFIFQDFNNLKTFAKEGMGFTFSYSAPEIRKLEGEEDWDKHYINFYQSDIYSLGLIFLNCCGVDFQTSKILSALPEKKHSIEIEDIIHSIRKNNPLAEYEMDFLQTIKKMLDFDPNSRLDINYPSNSFIDKENLQKIDILLVGETCVGKTSIIKKNFDNNFANNMQTTTGLSYRAQKRKNNCYLAWDTAGQEKYFFTVLDLIKGKSVSGIFIVVDDKDHKEINKFSKAIKENCRKDFPPIIILQNKVDLLDSFERERDLKMLKNFSIEYDIFDVMQVSAKTGENINEAFDRMYDEVERRENMLIEFRKRFKKSEEPIHLKNGEKNILKKNTKTCCE